MGLFAGIDVAKDTLAVAVSSGQEWSCANDPRGITLLVERLEAANPALAVLEATGGYEEELLAALIAAGIEARRVNPREVHHFARAAGQLAKTDRIDARMLALFAERIRPPARALSDPQAVQFRSEGAELTHRFGVTIRRDCHKMAVLSAIGPGRIGLNAFQQ